MTAKAEKIPHSRLRVFQNTSPQPSDLNHKRSTQYERAVRLPKTITATRMRKKRKARRRGLRGCILRGQSIDSDNFLPLVASFLPTTSLVLWQTLCIQVELLSSGVQSERLRKQPPSRAKLAPESTPQDLNYRAPVGRVVYKRLIKNHRESHPM